MNDRRPLALAAALILVSTLLVSGFPDEGAAQGKPEGEIRWALYVTLTPVWFDPGEVVGQLTPFWVLYEFFWPSGIGSRVADPALMLINPYPWSAPLEDVRLKTN